MTTSANFPNKGSLSSPAACLSKGLKPPPSPVAPCPRHPVSPSPRAPVTSSAESSTPRRISRCQVQAPPGFLSHADALGTRWLISGSASVAGPSSGGTCAHQACKPQPGGPRGEEHRLLPCGPELCHLKLGACPFASTSIVWPAEAVVGPSPSPEQTPQLSGQGPLDVPTREATGLAERGWLRAGQLGSRLPPGLVLPGPRFLLPAGGWGGCPRDLSPKNSEKQKRVYPL